MPRTKSYNYSLKFLSLIVHIIICGILALNFLYFVAFYNTGAVSIPDPDGATDVRPEPGAIYATAQEGFTFGWTNNEGYYNLYDYTRGMSIDVLMMGASHMTGSHLFTKDTASFVLNRLSGLAVYNIGASAHDFLTCANNIQAAAEKYHPGKYIVIETGDIKFSDKMLDTAVKNMLPEVTVKNRGSLRLFVRQNRYFRFLWNKIIGSNRCTQTERGICFRDKFSRTAEYYHAEDQECGEVMRS